MGGRSRMARSSGELELIVMNGVMRADGLVPG